jgi:anti-anti-sigma factor
MRDEQMTDATVTRQDNQAVIQPAGDLVAASVAALRSVMRGIVGDGVQELVVDLTHAQMVDSSGIGLLLSAHNSLCRTGGRLAVIHASPEILDLFMTMRIHQHFSVSGG